MNSDIVELNVGGRLFATTRQTLCKENGSMLAKIFDTESKFAPPPKTSTGAFFLDHDSDAFAWILKYLRLGPQVFIKSTLKELSFANMHLLRYEADYFGLLGLVSCVDERLETLRPDPHNKDKMYVTDIPTDTIPGKFPEFRVPKGFKFVAFGKRAAVCERIENA